MKKVLLATLAILTFLTITGCGKKEEKKDEKSNVKEEVKTGDKKAETEEIVISNPGAVIGTQIYDVKLNNKDIKLKVEYINYPKAKLDENDDVFYLTYKIYLDDKFIDGLAIGKILLDDEDMKGLIETNYNNNNYDYFKDTLNPTILRGKDKEYLLLHVQGGGFLNEELLYIINDSAKFLGGLYIDKNMGLQIVGKSSERYKTEESASVINYYFIDVDKITYLKPTDEMFIDKNGKKQDFVSDREKYMFDEYTITVNNDKLENTKTDNEYQGSEPEGGDSEFTEFIAK